MVHLHPFKSLEELLYIFSISLLAACHSTQKNQTFAQSLQKLHPIQSLEILQEGNSMIAVSGAYQGRIFTSSSKGMNGKSYGWVNEELIKKGEHASNMASLGGESRIWFAPEFGQYSLCFEAGAEQTDENMFRPFDLNNKKFTELNRTKKSLTVGGQMQFKNAQNFVFEVDMERTITLLSKAEIEQHLGVSLPNAVAYVGFSAETTYQNIGTAPFQKETGLIALWELGCMRTSSDNVVIIPLSQPTDSITEYFTPIADRMQIQNQVVFYKADAQGLNKIGIPPQFCKNLMGSYSPSDQLLNIVTFTFEKDSLYVNSLPNNTTPYQGDVINIFNGEVNPDKGWNWDFYEFESSSSAKELKSNERQTHRQTTFHFEGTEAELEGISKEVLGVSLREIPIF